MPEFRMIGARWQQCASALRQCAEGDIPKLVKRHLIAQSKEIGSDGGWLSFGSSMRNGGDENLLNFEVHNQIVKVGKKALGRPDLLRLIAVHRDLDPTSEVVRIITMNAQAIEPDAKYLMEIPSPSPFNGTAYIR